MPRFPQLWLFAPAFLGLTLASHTGLAGAQPQDKTVRLDDFKDNQSSWQLELGPRTQGMLTVVKDDPSPGQSSFRFAADFSNNGVSARITKNLKPFPLNDTSVIKLKIKSETATSYGIVFLDSSGQTHQKKGNLIQPDNQWRDVEFDPKRIAGGEHWGGANDGRWHGAPTSFALTFNARSDAATMKPTISISDMRVITGVSTTPPETPGQPLPPPPPASPPLTPEQKARNAEYQDFNPGDKTAGGEWVQSIGIKSPELRSEVKGDVKVVFQAPSMTEARALCWQQPTKSEKNPAGHDAVVAAKIPLDAEGNGSFVFPADQFPNGPIIVRILTRNEAGQRDIRELQLFNKGGVVWNQGIPKSDPPQAAGMKVVYADDFDQPLSISKDGQNAKYFSHKPGGGDFSGWPFTDYESPNNPFAQLGTWLRIRASKAPDAAKGSTGLISPVKKDGTGFYMTMPFYAECRFTAQSAPGTWPAFWTMTKNAVVSKGSPGDELDIVEAYGGNGPGNPNHPGYSMTTHFWKQTGPDGQKLKNINKRLVMSEVGDKSYWSTKFHTYGVKVTEAETTYYLDDIEVMKHPTGPISKAEPAFFMINLAIGGISGWKIDLAREGNMSDMWVDYVRVYQGVP